MSDMLLRVSISRGPLNTKKFGLFPWQKRYKLNTSSTKCSNVILWNLQYLNHFNNFITHLSFVILLKYILYFSEYSSHFYKLSLHNRLRFTDLQYFVQIFLLNYCLIYFKFFVTVLSMCSYLFKNIHLWICFKTDDHL